MSQPGGAASAGELLEGRTVHGAASARWTIEGRPYVNFGGCGYLALADLLEIRDEVKAAMLTGVSFSRQLSAAYGARDPIFDAVEEVGAMALNCETSVHLASGYLIGMVGVAISQKLDTHIFLDDAAHYNMRDAAVWSGLPVRHFAQRDPGALENALRRDLTAGKRPLVLTDGVFATSGELAPLGEYARLVEPFDGHMLVDDAHGFGVVGANGRGTAEFLGVEDRCTIGVTLSKAYCSHGALVGCSWQQADRVQSLPPVRGANSGSTLSAVVSHAALRFMLGHPERRERHAKLTAGLRCRLRSAGYTIAESPAPIVSFGFGRRADMQAMQRKLFERGFFVPISNYLGSGPEGVFRLSVFADHEEGDFDALLAAME